MHLIIQFAGAVAILVPFASLQFGWMGQQDWAYLWLNLVGSALLTVDAWRERQWGFVVLQAVWGVVAAWGLIKRRACSAPQPQ